MVHTVSSSIPQNYLDRVKALLAAGSQRVLLGLVGAPGAGKSTLAERLHLAFPGISQIVPMDGYHLANSELRRLGRIDRKGAPDTFDSAGYVSLLQRLRNQSPTEVVYAPEFRRDIDEAVAGAIPVESHIQLIITEGNYLLMSESHWKPIASLLDEVWYVNVDDQLRRRWLVQRHERFGRSTAQATAWVDNIDEPNARRIQATRARATVEFSWA